MKALVYTANKEMTYRDEPAPEPSQGEALIGIEYVGICGSDMHAYLGHDSRRVPPMILGHEAVGTVLLGTDVGQRVVLNPLISCGECIDCLSGRQNICTTRDLIGMYRAGAFAEKIAIPERNIIKVPSGMPSYQAALTEPGATGLHAVSLAERIISRPICESTALVIGGGSVGLLTALILNNKGVKNAVIHETNALRRNMIIEHTGLNAVDPNACTIKESHFDLVFDAVGNAKTREHSVNAVKSGGVIVHIGLMDNSGALNVRRMTLQEITFIGCYTYSPVDLHATLNQLSSGALGDLSWLETRPLADGASAFKDLLKGNCASPKVILEV